MKLRGVMAAVALATALGVHAQDTVVDVARATVRLPAGQWVELQRDKVDAVQMENRGSIPAERLSIALVEGQQVNALVTITATAGGAGGKIMWTSDCESSTDVLWVKRPKGGNPDDMECAYASTAFESDRWLREETSVVKALQRLKLEVPTEVVLVSADMGSRMGALMSVEVLADERFTGSAEVRAEVLPEGVPEPVEARHAAFALLLAERVRDCLYSFRGRMDFPAISFIAPAPAGARVALSTL